MGRKTSQIKAQMVSTMEIPRDLAYQEVLLTVTGNTSVCIENYRSILEYTTQKVLLLTKNGRLQITGKCLEIQSYTSDEMLITGHITEVAFLN